MYTSSNSFSIMFLHLCWSCFLLGLLLDFYTVSLANNFRVFDEWECVINQLWNVPLPTGSITNVNTWGSSLDRARFDEICQFTPAEPQESWKCDTWRMAFEFYVRPIETSRLDELVALYMGGRLLYGAQFLRRFSLGFIRAMRTRKKESGNPE